MRYLSVCSGIEAATVAWEALGWEAAGFCEIDKFPSATLAHHYPDVPNYGDLNAYGEWIDDVLAGPAVDVLVGGTPCQSFSVAGLRAGMDDPRGNLALVFLGLVDRVRPRWVVWENVPGVLSSTSHDAPDPCPPPDPVDVGREDQEVETEEDYEAEEIHSFNAFLAALSEIGYQWAYRVYDAQYFGLAQRRKRVFVVGHLGAATGPAAVLFDRASLRGDPAPSRETGERAAGTLEARASTGGYDPGAHGAASGHLVAGQCHGSNVGPMGALRAGNGNETGGVPFVTDGPLPFDTTQVTSKLNRSAPKKGDPCHPLAAGAHAPAIAFNNRQDPISREEVCEPIGAKDNGSGVLAQGVRRLTPRECERLQGLPDDYTQIPWRKKVAEECPDGHRYKALGNSMAVPVMRRIGERIAFVESVLGGK